MVIDPRLPFGEEEWIGTDERNGLQSVPSTKRRDDGSTAHGRNARPAIGHRSRYSVDVACTDRSTDRRGHDDVVWSTRRNRTGRRVDVPRESPGRIVQPDVRSSC